MPAEQPPAGSSPLVSAEWLAGHLGDTDLRILDCRYYFDEPGRGRRDYREAHIPGALYLDWTEDISQEREGLKLMAPSADHFQSAMRRLGISHRTVVLGYDDEGGHYVSRLWLIARRFGHEVRMLNGGWTRWKRDGLPTRSGDEQADGAGTFTPRDAEPGLLVDAAEVLQLKEDPKGVLLDVRRWSEFTGDEVRAARGGRIPGARWMLWQDNLEWEGDREFRPLNQIRQRYEEAGVTSANRIVTYCHGGVRAAHTAFALNLLGYTDVRVYDGSWEEWGGRADLAIETGPS